MSAGALSRHTLSQLKFIVPGSAITAYLSTHAALWRLVEFDPSDTWARHAALGSVAFALLTISLFLYILLVPWLRNIEPNFQLWRNSGTLSKVIPSLTASILLGWSLLSFTLGRYSGMGYIEGTFAACGLYMLMFGLLGLIPAPKLMRD